MPPQVCAAGHVLMLQLLRGARVLNLYEKAPAKAVKIPRALDLMVRNKSLLTRLEGLLAAGGSLLRRHAGAKEEEFMLIGGYGSSDLIKQLV